MNLGRAWVDAKIGTTSTYVENVGFLSLAEQEAAPLARPDRASAPCDNFATTLRHFATLCDNFATPCDNFASTLRLLGDSFATALRHFARLCAH